MQVLGVDIGGSEIKAGIVDVSSGALTAPTRRLPTPEEAPPEVVAALVVELVDSFDWSGTVGCTFPAPIVEGVPLTATYFDDRWIGIDAAKLLGSALGRSVRLINDADAAGLAELSFGAARSVPGTVLVLTFGTGIGSAFIVDGRLALNTELGDIEFLGQRAEEYASARQRSIHGLSMHEWAKRVSEYLTYISVLFCPNLIVIGGGISDHWSEFADSIDEDLRCAPATFRNDAGIIGAALWAAEENRFRLPVTNKHRLTK